MPYTLRLSSLACKCPPLFSIFEPALMLAHPDDMASPPESACDSPTPPVMDPSPARDLAPADKDASSSSEDTSSSSEDSTCFGEEVFLDEYPLLCDGETYMGVEIAGEAPDEVVLLTPEECHYARQFSELLTLARMGKKLTHGLAISVAWAVVGDAAQDSTRHYSSRTPESRLMYISKIVSPLAEIITFCLQLSGPTPPIPLGHPAWGLQEEEYRVRSSVKFVADEFQKIAVEIVTAESTMHALLRREVAGLALDGDIATHRSRHWSASTAGERGPADEDLRLAVFGAV